MRNLSHSEIRRLSAFAKASHFDEFLTFVESLPEKVYLPEPLIVGTRQSKRIILQGEIPRAGMILELWSCDRTFNPLAKVDCFRVFRKASKPRNTLAPIYRAMKNAFKETCLASHLSNCGKKVVRAHTVQLAAFKKLAEDGHVYSFDWLRNKGTRIWPTKIGIRRATAMTGFCDVHDRLLFEPIENKPFKATTEQCFLFHYRAVAHGFYQRKFVGSALDTGMDEVSEMVGGESKLRLKNEGFLHQLDLDEVHWQKSAFDGRLLRQDWSSVETIAFRGAAAPTVFAAEFFAPQTDFSGRILQTGTLSEARQWVSLTITADEGNALVLISGEKGSPVLKQFADSLAPYSSQQLTGIFLTHVFCLYENFVIVPAWWKALQEPVQRRYANAYSSRYFPRTLPAAADWQLRRVA
jgi:hypothetical protein